MNESYRATLVITMIALATGIASWRLIDIDTAPASPAPIAAIHVSRASRPPVPHDEEPRKAEPARDRSADLIAAAERGDIQGVLALAAKGGDINVAGQDGQTPLLALMSRGRIDPGEIEKLLKAGADATARDGKGRDALTLAAKRDDLNAIAVLLKSGGRVISQATNALRLAASDNHLEALKAMLDNGVDVNAAGRDGATALDAAVRHGDAETVRFLLRRGADPQRKEAEGATALMLAAKRGDREIVNALLEKAPGALNDRNSNGETALMQAVRARNAVAARAFADAGADVNAADFESNTPLIQASSDGSVELVQALLDKGADLRAANASGETALSLARKNDHPDVVEMLIRAGAPDAAPQ